ncbi:MAG: hypothetical protein KBC21_03120 [Candidatus Pacebacteria bacterium]|nr:hypothetical protein [Candidatus Paceibacterota bacterium]
MKKKYLITAGLFILVITFIFPKSYNIKGDESAQCKTVIIQEECLGKNISTPTSNPCATSAVCYGWLIE